MKQLLRDLKRIPGFATTYVSRKLGFGEGKCRHFRIRWHKSPDYPDTWVVDFGVRKHFDRWSNSTNFRCVISYRSAYRPDILQGYRWMAKVLQSGLFNWNSYLTTLDIQCDYIQKRKARKIRL